MTIKLNDLFIAPTLSFTDSTVTEKHNKICQQIESMETNIGQIVDTLPVESIVSIYIELLKNGWEIEKSNNINGHFIENRICKLEDHLATSIMTVDRTDTVGDGINRKLDNAILDVVRKNRITSETEHPLQNSTTPTYINVRQIIVQFSLVSRVDNFFNSSIKSTEDRLLSAAVYPFKTIIGDDLEICWVFYSMIKQMWHLLCGKYKMPSRQTDLDVFVLFFELIRQFYGSVKSLF